MYQLLRGLGSLYREGVVRLVGELLLVSKVVVAPNHYPAWSTLIMGVSENSVPLNPMVNDHYPY